MGGEGVEPLAYRLTRFKATALQTAVRNTTRKRATCVYQSETATSEDEKVVSRK